MLTDLIFYALTRLVNIVDDALDAAVAASQMVLQHASVVVLFIQMGRAILLLGDLTIHDLNVAYEVSRDDSVTRFDSLVADRLVFIVVCAVEAVFRPAFTIYPLTNFAHKMRRVA